MYQFSFDSVENETVIRVVRETNENRCTFMLKYVKGESIQIIKKILLTLISAVSYKRPRTTTATKWILYVIKNAEILKQMSFKVQSLLI